MKNACSKKKTLEPLQQKPEATLNPFEEFRSFQFKREEIPLDQIVQTTEVVMNQIRLGYERLLEEEAKELVWMVQYNTIIKAYEVAEKYIKEIDYSAEDIEDFCFALENTQRIPYLIPGPAGHYISSISQRAQETRTVL